MFSKHMRKISQLSKIKVLKIRNRHNSKMSTTRRKQKRKLSQSKNQIKNRSQHKVSPLSKYLIKSQSQLQFQLFKDQVKKLNKHPRYKSLNRRRRPCKRL